MIYIGISASEILFRRLRRRGGSGNHHKWLALFFVLTRIQGRSCKQCNAQIEKAVILLTQVTTLHKAEIDRRKKKTRDKGKARVVQTNKVKNNVSATERN